MTGLPFKFLFLVFLFAFSLAGMTRFFLGGARWAPRRALVTAHKERGAGASTRVIIEASYDFNGQAYVSELNETANPYRCKLGQKVNILVDTRHPARAIMDDARQLYIAAVVCLFTIIGFFFV